ncbi:hypothetical protein PSP6_160090 [Paraburkholderia tropica]|nr:hypothetical protein PSP6_160090 [Paraburkholderia tropica]
MNDARNGAHGNDDSFLRKRACCAKKLNDVCAQNGKVADLLRLPVSRRRAVAPLFSARHRGHLLWERGYLRCSRARGRGARSRQGSVRLL